MHSTTGARATIRLDPYGQPRGASAAAWADGRGFLNAPVDAASGLVRLGLRLYDSTLGRFLSVDPVLSPGNPQQNNGYSYAANNPVTYSDASGGCYLGPGDTCAGNGGPGGKTKAPKLPAAPPSAKKDAPPKKAAQQEEQWWNPWSWSESTWKDLGDSTQDAMAIVAGIGVGVGIVLAVAAIAGCAAITFGVCGVVIVSSVLVAGGIGAGVTYATMSGDKSWEGASQAVGWGMAGSAAGLLVGPVAGAVTAKIATATAPKIAAEAAPKAAQAAEAGAATKAVDGMAEVATNAPKITFGHGARHLEGTGLGIEEVESTISQRVTTAAGQATSETGSFWGRIQIRGTTVEYRAYTLPDGTINVGTYYVP
ncbi:MAG: RHS repeat-associated core domain-containing protein [Protaetiibacter sp.]